MCRRRERARLVGLRECGLRNPAPRRVWDSRKRTAKVSRQLGHLQQASASVSCWIHTARRRDHTSERQGTYREVAISIRVDFFPHSSESRSIGVASHLHVDWLELLLQCSAHNERDTMARRPVGDKRASLRAHACATAQQYRCQRCPITSNQRHVHLCSQHGCRTSVTLPSPSLSRALIISSNLSFENDMCRGRHSTARWRDQSRGGRTAPRTAGGRGLLVPRARLLQYFLLLTSYLSLTSYAELL